VQERKKKTKSKANVAEKRKTGSAHRSREKTHSKKKCLTPTRKTGKKWVA